MVKNVVLMRLKFAVTVFTVLRCPAVFGVEMKIYERSLQALLSVPHPPLSRLLSSIKFSRYPQMERFLAG